MRKLTGKCKWILAVLLVTVSMAAGCNKVKDINADVSDPSEASHKISVVATVFPYYDFARAIGGEYLDVTLLLPPGRDSHSFEPTAQDLLTLQSADIFLYNGGEMETWVEEVLEAVPRSHGITFQGIETVDLLEEAHTKSMKTTGHSHDHDEDEDHDEEEEHDHDEEDNIIMMNMMSIYGLHLKMRSFLYQLLRRFFVRQILSTRNSFAIMQRLIANRLQMCSLK